MAIPTPVPVAAIGALVAWTQNVSPTADRTSSRTFVMPGASVRAVALSQSLPTA